MQDFYKFSLPISFCPNVLHASLYNFLIVPIFVIEED